MMNKPYKSEAPIVSTPNASSESKQYLHTTTAGVTLPFLQASFTALGIFIGSFLICWLVLDLLDPFKYAITFAVIAWIVVLFLSMRQWFTLTNIEHATGIDLNRDGKIGDPSQYVSIRLTEEKDNGHVAPIKRFTLPATEEQLQLLAVGLLEQGRKFSEKEWAGNDKPFSLDKFRELRSEMIKRGLLAQANTKDPRQGYTLTLAGKAVLRHYLPSPTPMAEMPES